MATLTQFTNFTQVQIHVAHVRFLSYRTIFVMPPFVFLESPLQGSSFHISIQFSQRIANSFSFSFLVIKWISPLSCVVTHQLSIPVMQYPKSDTDLWRTKFLHVLKIQRLVLNQICLDFQTGSCRVKATCASQVLAQVSSLGFIIPKVLACPQNCTKVTDYAISGSEGSMNRAVQHMLSLGHKADISHKVQVFQAMV